MSNTPEKNMCYDAKSDARLNVLYSPFRKRDVNPQDWDSKMSYWKNNIMDWCLSNNSLLFSLLNLQSAFVRNGRPASCLATVVEDMSRNSEIVRLQDLLDRDPASQSWSWSLWAVNCLVKAPIVWTFSKLKESLLPKPDCLDEKYVHLGVLKKHSDDLRDHFKSQVGKSVLTLEEIKTYLRLADILNVRVVLHWLMLQGQAVVKIVGGETVVKLSADNHPESTFSDTDVGLLQLRQNEQTLTHTLVQLEEEKQAAEHEVRAYLRKGMQQAAKSCLRKKKELDKCIDKRASALENVHVILSRVKEAEADGEILGAYKLGLSAMKATFKNTGLSEDGVFETMDQVKEVLEVHEEIQSALSEPMAASHDKDLEDELTDLLVTGTVESILDTHGQSVLPDLPEPPSHSPTATKTTTTSRRIAENLHYQIL